MLGVATIKGGHVGVIDTSMYSVMFKDNKQFVDAVVRMIMSDRPVDFWTEGGSNFKVHINVEADEAIAEAMRMDLMDPHGVTGGLKDQESRKFEYLATFTENRDLREAAFRVLTQYPWGYEHMASFGYRTSGGYKALYINWGASRVIQRFIKGD